MTKQDFEPSTVEAEIQYWLRREREERVAATAARDVSAREAHISLAERCAERAKSFSERNAHTAAIPSWPKGDGKTAIRI